MFLEFFCFSCFLKMFPLHVLDQVQLTLLTHEKTASLKTRKKHTTRVPCSVFLSIWPRLYFSLEN